MEYIDQGLLTFVIGLIFTIAIGYIGIKFTLKQRRVTSLIFLINSRISLFNKIVKNLDDLEIRFQGDKIDENLILLSGTFINDGTEDIDQSLVHGPLELEIPEEYSWASCKIINKSNDLKITHSIHGKKLVLEWDLLKEGEFVTFDGLVDYKEPTGSESHDDICEELVSNLLIRHRITNMKKVECIPSLNKVSKPASNLSAIGVLSVLLLIAGWIGYGAVSTFVTPKFSVWHKIVHESNEFLVTINAEDDSKLKFTDISEEITINTPLVDSKKLLTGELVIVPKEINYVAVAVNGIASLLIFFVIVMIIILEIKTRHLYKKLQLFFEQNDTS